MAFATPPEVLLRKCLRGSPRLIQKALAGNISQQASSSRTYRAAVCGKLGTPLEIVDKKYPKNLDSDKVLVSTHAVGINFADILTCKGQYQVRLKTPFVPGNEIAGKVVEVGSGVTNVKKGDRVFVLSAQSAGGMAEYIVADSFSLVPVPDNLSLVQAAGTVISYGTAMMALTRKAKIKKHEKVLITAAAGATGLAAADIAKSMFDCEVYGVVGSEEKCKFLKERGIDHTINYSTDSIRDKVKELTGGEGVHVALDQVGGDSLLECVKSLKFEGRALTIGYASGKIPEIPANQLLLKSSSLIGVFWGSYSMQNPPAFFESITQVIEGIVQGKLNPYVGKTFPLEKVNEAFQYILDRKSVGKVVLKIKEEDHPAE